MRKHTIVMFTLLLAARLAAAAPVISEAGVVNAASHIAPGLPNYGIARGSIFVVKGSGFATNGVSVKVTIDGSETDAAVISASDAQIIATLPAATPAGQGTVTVTSNGETTAPAVIRVVDSAFGIFTVSANGMGAAVTAPRNTANESAQPGQTLSLLGTGLGDGDIEVYVGGKAAEVSYKGALNVGEPSGLPVPAGTAGLNQVDIVVPEGVQGCGVPVAVRTGDFVSNFAALAVMPQAGACSDPHGMSAEEYQRLLEGGTFKTGSITLGRTATRMDLPGFGTLDMKTDSASASFFKYEAGDLLANAAAYAPASFGACTVMTFRNGENIDVNPIKFTALDAGEAINITGPKGAKQLTRQKDGTYSAEFGTAGLPGIPGLPPATLFLDPGSYTADNGSGGSDVGKFQATLNMPAPITWTNSDEINEVTRAEGVSVTWTGGNPEDFVTISGSSVNKEAIGVFTCIERAAAGAFTVPPVVTLSLPATDDSENAMGALSLQSSTYTRFNAPGLDTATINSFSASGKGVGYK